MKEAESTLKRIFQSFHSIVVHVNQNIIYVIVLRHHVINSFHACNVSLQYREQLNRVQFVDQSLVIVDCPLFSITIDLKLCFIEFLDEGSSVQLDGRVRIQFITIHRHTPSWYLLPWEILDNVIRKPQMVSCLNLPWIFRLVDSETQDVVSEKEFARWFGPESGAP